MFSKTFLKLTTVFIGSGIYIIRLNCFHCGTCKGGQAFKKIDPLQFAQTKIMSVSNQQYFEQGQPGVCIKQTAMLLLAEVVVCLNLLCSICIKVIVKLLSVPFLAATFSFHAFLFICLCCISLPVAQLSSLHLWASYLGSTVFTDAQMLISAHCITLFSWTQVGEKKALQKEQK